MIQRHPPDEWLIGRAAGTLPEALDLIVAVHLLWCPRCRELTADAEALAAGAAAQAAPLPIDPAGLNAVLSRLNETPPTPPAGRLGMPSCLAPWADGPWSWLAPGTWGVDLPHATTGALPLRLVWMRAGMSLPHRHVGDETALVLSGGWTDQHGHVGPGDCHTSTDRGLHEQVVDRGEPCVALVLADAKAQPPLRWRWLSPLFKT